MSKLDVTALNEVDIREQIIWENQRRDPRSGEAAFSAKHLVPSSDPPASCDPLGDAMDRSAVDMGEGFRELKGWEVDHSSISDAEGWTYFAQFPERAAPPSSETDTENVMVGEVECTKETLVRRRYWTRLIVKDRDFNRAQLLLQTENGKRNVRHAYNLDFVRDVMQSIPYCVSLVHENERLKKKKKASELSHFSKDAMRSSDVHIWTDAYSDLPSIQEVLGSETRMTLTASPSHTSDRRSISGSRRSMSHPSTNFLCATVDSVAVPDGWAVIRGFNFVVDAGTDLAGWQYANSFFETEERGSALPPHVGGAPADHSYKSMAASMGSTRRSQTCWTDHFDGDSQCVRRRLWCRIMCPVQYQQRALAACERYLKKRPRGEILSSPDVFVEIDGCCSSSYKLQRAVLRDNCIEYFSGQKRTGVFPVSHLSRVRLQDSRVADHRAHPLLMRVEDVGGAGRDPDYIAFAMKSEALRMMWCDAVRHQVGLLDYSGRDLLGGPPEDPSVPMYSSSLSSHTSMNTGYAGLIGSPSMVVTESEMNTLHRSLIANEYPILDEGEPDAGPDERPAADEAQTAGSPVRAAGEAHEVVQSPLFASPQPEESAGEDLAEQAAPEPAATAAPSPAPASPAPASPAPAAAAAPAEPPVTPSETSPVDDATTSDHELVLMGSLCRKRLLGDRLYHVRFVWIAKTPQGMAFHWAKSEAKKSENKSFLIRDIESINLAPHKRNSVFMGNRSKDDLGSVSGSLASSAAGTKTVARRGSDVSSVTSSADNFDSQAVTIRCRKGTAAGDLKVPGVEIKLESNDIALKWIEIIRSMMDFNL